MKLDIDVYISYAHLDNLELTEGGQGWVERFRRALQMRLTQLLGREAIVVLEDKLRGNDVFADDVVNKAGGGLRPSCRSCHRDTSLRSGRGRSWSCSLARRPREVCRANREFSR